MQSIYHDLGSGVVPEGTGIVLQNRGSFFSLDPDHPDRLEPGKQTFHTLCPALVLREDGSPYAAIGTMGAEGQPQTKVVMLTRLVDFGYDVQQTIEAPRWLMGSHLLADPIQGGAKIWGYPLFGGVFATAWMSTIQSWTSAGITGSARGRPRPSGWTATGPPCCRSYVSPKPVCSC